MSMDTLDILLKLEFPSVPTHWGLSDIISDAPISNEVIFRFNYDPSFVRYGLGAISALFLPKLAHAYQESSGRKTDCDISSLWSALTQQLNERPRKQEVYPAWIDDVRMSIAQGDMKLAPAGVGGTYFVYGGHNEHRVPVAVFKPVDEEPGAPNNPKETEGFVPMLPWGKGAHREVAAARLGQSYLNVPETYLVETTNTDGIVKKGSIQKYVPNDGDCSDVGANKFSIDSVHRLGIFDISILNMDRNDENLLVQKNGDESWNLIPIDHTYCFPVKVNSYFNWQYWTQAKKPFSTETVDLIASTNVLVNAQRLLDLGIEEESVRNVIASTCLLQQAAQKGLVLFQIAAMVSGPQNVLVDIIAMSKEKEEKYYEAFYPQGSETLQTSKKLSIFKNIIDSVLPQFLDRMNLQSSL